MESTLSTFVCLCFIVYTFYQYNAFYSLYTTNCFDCDMISHIAGRFAEFNQTFACKWVLIFSEIVSFPHPSEYPTLVMGYPGKKKLRFKSGMILTKTHGNY